MSVSSGYLLKSAKVKAKGKLRAKSKVKESLPFLKHFSWKGFSKVKVRLSLLKFILMCLPILILEIIPKYVWKCVHVAYFIRNQAGLLVLKVSQISDFFCSRSFLKN